MTVPLPDRPAVAGLLLLTAATGLVDAVSVLALGHVFVANMTGNVIFLGFWLVPHSGVDLAAAVVAVAAFLAGTIISGRLIRHLGHRRRIWLVATLGAEITVLVVMSILTATGILHYQDNSKLVLITGLAVTFGLQNAMARQFGVQELSTTVLTSTIVGLGVDSRLAGGTARRAGLRYGVVVAMCGGAVIGATLSRVGVAPVIGLAAAVIAVALLLLWQTAGDGPIGVTPRRTPGAGSS